VRGAERSDFGFFLILRYNNPSLTH
jgi:hypothetical protein